jgi:hypothetical protein
MVIPNTDFIYFANALTSDSKIDYTEFSKRLVEKADWYRLNADRRPDQEGKKSFDNIDLGNINKELGNAFAYNWGWAVETRGNSGYAIDINGSPKVLTDKYRLWIGAEDYAKILVQSMDKNGDGLVDESEFNARLASPTKIRSST